MSTGIESWNVNLLEIGPMYPFAGTEGLWVIVGLATWILWHVVQGIMESRFFREEDEAYENKELLDQAMQISKAETLMESMKSYAEGFERQTKRK